MPNQIGTGAAAPSADQRTFPGLSASLLAGSAVLALAYLLGVRWLEEPVLGLPFGLWVLASAALVRGLWACGAVSAIAAWIESLPRRLPELTRARPTPAWPENRLGSLGFEAVGKGVRGVLLCAFGAIDRAAKIRFGRLAPKTTPEERAIAWLDARPGLPLPARALRIGVYGPDELVSAIIAAPGAGVGVGAGIGVGAVAVRTEAPETSRHVLQGERLDAKIVIGDGQVRIRFREDFALEASWYDWGSPRPATYGNLFPLRVDPAMLTMEIGAQPPDPAGVRVLAEAGAALSRIAPRLTLADRLSGRTPLDPSPALRALSEYAIANRSRPFDPAVRAAARVSSAWLVTEAAGATPAERRAATEAVAEILADEVGTTLRLVAVRLASGDEEAGIEALRLADAALRRATDLPDVDHAAFLQAEIDHAGPSEMSLGRVAAGICLLAARTEPQRVEYLVDDLLEELRYAEWLVGNDPDARTLHRVINEIKRSRVAELRGLPPVGVAPGARAAA